MKQNYMNSEELKKLFQPELESIYEIEVESLESDVRINKVLNPVLLSVDGKLLDGYRRVLAALKCGVGKIPYLQTNLEPTADNRVTLNQHRYKTWKDERSDLLISFETFACKQGQKMQNGYDRYKEIAMRTRFRYKDAKSLKQVEEILKNDKEGYPFAYWLLAKQADLSSLKSIIEMMKKNENSDLVDQVLALKLSPKSAVKMIEDRVKNSSLRDKAFKLPEANSENIIVHSGYEEEIMKMLEKDNATMFYYEPDICTSSFDDDPESRTNKNHLVSVYAMHIANKVKPYVKTRLQQSGSFFIAVKEYYSNGIAKQLPSEVVYQVEKETELIYKQTLYCTSPDSFRRVRKGNQLPDSITHILWFVKKYDSEIAGSIFPFRSNSEISFNAPYLYRQCSNYIDQQKIPDVVVNYKDKDVTVDALAIITVFLTTKENDLIVDLSMKGELSSAATVMNRRFIGLARDFKTVDSSSKKLINALKSYDQNYASQLFDPISEENDKIEFANTSAAA